MALNLAWLCCGGGLLVAALYLVSGCVLCLTIFGIPFGLQLFKLAHLAIFPFGNSIENHYKLVHDGGHGDVDGGAASCCYSLVMCLANLVFLPVSLLLLLIHLVAGLALACSIVGLPFAYAHMKLASLAVCPFNKEVQPSGITTRVTSTTTMFNYDNIPV
jgi:uncharacterized membrane protein YccF (DUF307 family)